MTYVWNGSRLAVNEPDPSPYEPDPQIEADAIRLQQWDIFVASLRDYAAAWTWADVLVSLSNAYEADFDRPDGRDENGDPWDPRAVEIRLFAEGYGWPDTLRALAQAIQADEQMKREAEARR